MTHLFKLNLILLISILSVAVKSQNSSDSLFKYTPEFRFTDGIFLDFESVKRNEPIPKNRLMSDLNYDDNDFFDKTLAQNKIFYYDKLGNKTELDKDKVWGFSRNGFLYIRIENNYFRITLMGSICHFVAIISYENRTYYEPYYYNSPYYPQNTTTSTEQRQYLLDFSTGRVLNFDEEGVEILLMTDPELYDEFVQLSKKKKKQMKFMYIRKFNERNPLYLINHKKE